MLHDIIAISSAELISNYSYSPVCSFNTPSDNHSDEDEREQCHLDTFGWTANGGRAAPC
jgi:hypothetical protein